MRGVLRPAVPYSLALNDRMVLSLGTLAGYFDESGTHMGSRVVTVAGYISTIEQWEQFEAEWQAALAEFGVPYFHMADFVNRKKQFKGWTEVERRARLMKLVGIINRHVLASVGCGIPVAAYDIIFSKNAKRVTGGAYGLAATVCFMDAAKLLHQDYPTARIAYTFEGGAKGRGQILKVFNQNLNDREQRVRMKLASLIFAGKELVPLQAADILAYELYQHLPRQLGVDPDRRGSRT